MSSRQRAAFILLDGHRTQTDVLSLTSGLGVTETDILDLMTKGFVEGPETTGSANKSTSAQAESTAKVASSALVDPAQRYLQAYGIATKITGAMGLRGFRLHLSIEAAQDCDGLVALLPALAKAAPAAALKELTDCLGIPLESVISKK